MTSNRRSFIKHAVFLPSALYLTQCKTVGRTPNSGSFLKVNPVNGYLPKRVNWNSLSDSDQNEFIRVVTKMKKELKFKVPAEFGEGGARELDAWTAQAEVHKWYCPHGNWSFLPWHRAYLYHFELFLRQHIRDDFRLPYWDWTQDPKIPEKLQAAELLDTLGVSRESNTVDSYPPDGGWSGAIAAIASMADYSSIGGSSDSFSGLIENPYHNRVHVAIGGNMGQVAEAAHDPIFWLHHCNVDRLWSLWMDEQIARFDKNPADASGNRDISTIRAMFPATDVGKWLDESFPNNFWKPDGTLASATVRSSLFTEGLDYNYDTMKKTWTIHDIPADQPTIEVTAPVEKVEGAPAALRLAEVPSSSLTLQFTLPPAIFTGPTSLMSLNLALTGVPVPTNGKLYYSVSLVVQGRVLPLPEIVFFMGKHTAHGQATPGVNLDKHRKTLLALPAGQRTVQLALVLKDKQGKQQPIPNLSTDANHYKVKVMAVFK